MTTTTIYQIIMLVAGFLPAAFECDDVGDISSKMKLHVAFTLGMITVFLTHVTYGLLGNTISTLAEIITFLIFFFIFRMYLSLKKGTMNKKGDV